MAYHVIKQFINLVSEELNFPIKWKGKGINEKAFDKDNKCIIEINKKYFRPTEVETLRGSFKKAQNVLLLNLLKDIIYIFN